MKNRISNRPSFRVHLSAIVAVLAILSSFWLPTAAVANGPITPLNPAEQAMTTQEQAAQTLAVASTRVQELVAGHRAEVFEIFPFFGPYAPGYRACSDGTCYQVDVYDFDRNATVTALVHQGQGLVLDVFEVANTFPLINKRLYNRAVELIRTSADVEAALGFAPAVDQIGVMDQHNMGTACDGSHLCAGTTFFTDSGTVWVLVNLTEDKIEKIWWSERPQDLRSSAYSLRPQEVPTDCNTTIHVNRNGWNLDYRTTPTDALEITSLTYDVNGAPQAVATRMKLIEWHAHYPGNWGYRDYTGCGGGGGGFPIYPYGVTQVRDLLDQANAIVGFAVVQDFRMSNWGASCNYRYEQHFQFFNDGRFRVVTVSYGQGCGNNQDQEATYRPLVRIDIAVKGDSNDTLALWDGAQWVDQTTEGWWLQSAPYTPEGYRYRVMDQSGSGYYIEPARGQYNDGGTGDNAWLYVTQHKVAEGDADMPAIGQCCTGTYVQGPEQFINGEAVNNQNIVLWYIPQSETITTWRHNLPPYPMQYCWTDNVNATWPCFSGPMFVPTTLTSCSRYDLNCDDIVDTNDLIAVASHWNCMDEVQNSCYEARFDFNGDSIISIKDIGMNAARWGCALGELCYSQ